MSTRRGFSLLEIMLALAIVAALAGTVYAFLFDLIDSRNRIITESDRSRMGIGTIEQLERDLTTTLAGSSGFGAGIRGTATSIELLSRGVTLPIETDSQTVLGDMQGVSFSWRALSGELSANRWDVLSGERGEPEVISEEIAYLQFRYYDGDSWRGGFNSSSTLPVAIEVSIWFGEPQFESGSLSEVRAEIEDMFGASETALTEEQADAELLAIIEEEFDEPPIPPERAPDRVRVMVIPDGPSVGWEVGPS